MSRRVWVRDRTTALWLGYGMVTAGALLLWDAYEHRGRQRPFAAKFLPGA